MNIWKQQVKCAEQRRPGWVSGLSECELPHMQGLLRTPRPSALWTLAKPLSTRARLRTDSNAFPGVRVWSTDQWVKTSICSLLLEDATALPTGASYSTAWALPRAEQNKCAEVPMVIEAHNAARSHLLCNYVCPFFNPSLPQAKVPEPKTLVLWL